MKRILILGGTTEARQLAGKLVARADLEVTLSLAGRTENPGAQGVPTRVGGFGGAEGLADFLRETRIELLVDATHP
ncbi:MAG: cobalt-precorrin-6A reductase, partial [Mesorhizobium sp.]